MPKINGISVTTSQEAVYDVLKKYGPLADHALVPMAQHMVSVHQSSSGIRSRRAELVAKGLAVQTGMTSTGSGRRAGVFEAV